METMIAEVRAADQDTLYSLYFPDGGRVPAAAVADCVCLDYLTCTECERILGVSFRAIVLAARKKQRRDPPVPVTRVDAGPGQGLGPGSHAVEGSDAAISGMAGRLGRGRGSLPPSDGIEGSDGAATSSMVDLPGRGSHQPSDGIEGSNAAISGMAGRLGRGSHPPSDGIERSDGAATSTMVDLPGRGSHQPSDGIERPGSNGGVEVFDAAMAERLVAGSPRPSDGVKGPDVAMADRLEPDIPVSNGGIEGFEAGISGMAARLRLATAVGERAKEVFREIEEARAWPPGPGRKRDRNRFRSERPLVYAACLSIACRAEGSALSLRELAWAAEADGRVAKKDIAWLIEHIRRRLGQSTGTGMVCVSSYVRRFGALVELREAESAVALEAARRLEAGVLDARQNAESLAAAVVCLVLERAGARKPGVEDIAAANGLPKDTIYRVCKSLRPHANLLFG